MPEPSFSILIPIRYGDIDAQGHVNNARYATYIEQARVSYLERLGLWDGQSFEDIGLIVADVHIAYRAPAFYGQTLRIGSWVTRLGNKSLRFEYRLEDTKTGELIADADSVMVAYDYHTHQAMPVPETWRQRIARFEGIPERENHS